MNSSSNDKALQARAPITSVLRGCRNQTASEMEICKPWSFVPNIPESARTDKASFRKWAAAKDTAHLFFTASEGICPTMRVRNETNPIRRLHGLIADYDAAVNSTLIEEQLAKWSGENQPNWISRTFSDGARVVWLFEEPIVVDNKKLIDAFLKIAAEELRVDKFLPGRDKEAWDRLSQIYEVGRDWRRISDSPLTKEQLHEWLFRAAKKVKWQIEGAVIPLEVIAEWVELDFPGRWDGPFEEGSRGCAFFDSFSTNPTSSIVTKAGMVCFSQAKTFYPWGEIFPERAKKFNQDRIGGAVADTYYDGRSYWRKSDGIFVSMSREDLVTKLKVQFGLHATKRQWDSHSEVDAALHFIQEERRVDGALPLLYDENEMIYSNGKRFVNTSRVRVVQPADTKQEWGENFPWLASYHESRWDKTPVACVKEGHPPALAKEIFFAWQQRFYKSALQGGLLNGHALFVVGPVNSGKTLLSVRIVGASMGGHSEASDFLSGGSGFNRELIETPLWCIDDGTLSGDANSHQKFSEIIKRTVANPFFSYHPKFHDQQRAEWRGRVMVTLNGDATSVRMIPSLYESLEEKVIVLKFTDEPMTFPADVEAIVARELPFYLRWLLDWEVPAHIIGENRFGIKAFIHEEIRAAAIQSGEAGDILEIIELWIKTARPQERYGARWHGTATEWVSVVSGSGDEVLQSLIRKFTSRTIGRRLSELSRIRGSRVTKDDSKAKMNGNRYFISLEERADEPRYPMRTSFREPEQRKRAA